MRRLIIAIDCDDVLVPSTEYIVDEYNHRYGTKVTYARAHQSGNDEWGADSETATHRIHEIQLTQAYGAIAPFAEAVTAIDRLALDHELHLVTARDVKLLEVTEATIAKYFPKSFSSVEHVGVKGTKGDICSRLNVDILIDDNYKHLEHAASCGVENLLWFGDYPWSVEFRSTEGITFCKDWHQVEREVDRIAQQ